MNDFKDIISEIESLQTKLKIANEMMALARIDADLVRFQALRILTDKYQTALKALQLRNERLSA